MIAKVDTLIRKYKNYLYLYSRKHRLPKMENRCLNNVLLKVPPSPPTKTPKDPSESKNVPKALLKKLQSLLRKYLEIDILAELSGGNKQTHNPSRHL